MTKDELEKLLPLIQIEFELTTKQKASNIHVVGKSIEITVHVSEASYQPQIGYTVTSVNFATRTVTLTCELKIFKSSLKFLNSISPTKKSKKKDTKTAETE